MKRIIAILIPIVISISSCEKVELLLYPRGTGDQIVFSSSSKRGSDTKAAYSGEIDSKTKYERIDWQAGDDIRIYCAQAASSKYHDYNVINTKDLPISSAGSKSSAHIEPQNTATCLKWGNYNTDHIFTALYPAPKDDNTSVTEKYVTCYLPQSQTYSSISGTDDKIADINPDYLYLAGYGTAKSAADDNGNKEKQVDIYFDPAVTTFQFTLQNGFDNNNSMTITKAGITTSESGVGLSGKYKVKVDGINSTTGTLIKDNITEISVSGSDLYMEFSPEVTVANGKTFTFTLFAQPKKDISYLTFWFFDKEGVKRSFEFKYKEGTTEANNASDTQGYVKFPAFHKARITGILAPEKVGWTISICPTVVSWGDQDKEIEIDPGNVLTFDTAVTVWTNNTAGDIEFGDK